MAAPFAPATPYLSETRAWIQESRARRRRAAPVRWATLGVLVAALGVLAIADAVGGIVLPVYFWVGGGIVLAGLLTGHRPAPHALGTDRPARAGDRRADRVRQHPRQPARRRRTDGLGAGLGRQLDTPVPAGVRPADPRPAHDAAADRVRARSTSPMAGGQVRLLLPKTLNASVHAWVHAGDVRVDDSGDSNGLNDSGGFELQQCRRRPGDRDRAAADDQRPPGRRRRDRSSTAEVARVIWAVWAS